MKIETLVATIDQTDHSLVEKMNIQTEAIIGNQCGQSSEEVFEFRGNRVVYLNSAERGVGKNRNLLMQHAVADICIFADDDMQFLQGYPQTAKQAFQECPQADILIFNLVEKQQQRPFTKAITRIRTYNYAKYGQNRISQEAGISSRNTLQPFFWRRDRAWIGRRYDFFTRLLEEGA